jgi:hypothetical protein
MTLPDDVVQWIESAFQECDRETARQWLSAAVDHTGQPVGLRLLRSTAIASRGKLDELRYYLDLLRLDWRDVIVAGEYEIVAGKLTRVRDLTQPIVVT